MCRGEGREGWELNNICTGKESPHTYTHTHKSGPRIKKFSECDASSPYHKVANHQCSGAEVWRTEESLRAGADRPETVPELCARPHPSHNLSRGAVLWSFPWKRGGGEKARADDTAVKATREPVVGLQDFLRALGVGVGGEQQFGRRGGREGGGVSEICE